MSRETPRPFLISKDEDGSFRLTVRGIHYNSQGFPIVTSELQTESFKTAAAAKAFARENLGAKAGEYALR